MNLLPVTNKRKASATSGRKGMASSPCRRANDSGPVREGKIQPDHGWVRIASIERFPAHRMAQLR
jgi:hypothetical protein